HGRVENSVFALGVVMKRMACGSIYQMPRKGATNRIGKVLVCISPGWKRQRHELYVLALRQRLPVVPIPLRERESPVMLDLQALVEQVYETGRYDDLGYGAKLDPPLGGEDAAWAEALL